MLQNALFFYIRIKIKRFQKMKYGKILKIKLIHLHQMQNKSLL